MQSRLAIWALTAGLVAAAPVPGPEPVPWKVGLRSIGPLRYGMSLSEASSALGETLKVDLTEPGESCDYVRPSAAPWGVSFMVIDTVVERVDVSEGDVTTVSGAHIGSTEAEIKALYPGHIEVQPHPYTGPEGHYLIYVPRDPADTTLRIIFETDGDKVTMYRAGRRPAVEYIEGSS
jgi:hypothetical protein